MLEVSLDEELLIIGTFINEDGKEVRHASTFIRMECGTSGEAVVVHLDSNCDYPQCTRPRLLSPHYGQIADLEWRQFDRYSRIYVYRLVKHYDLTDEEKAKKLGFIKQIVEGPPTAPPIEAS